MPFFKSSNKSHSSIEDSRPEHPHQHPHHQAHPSASYAFDHHPDRYTQQPLTDEQYQIQDTQSQSQPHSAQHLSRSHSVSAGEVYGAQRPSVNLVPPPLQQHGIPEEPTPIPGQTFFGQSKSARIERDEKQKKSKRSFISGLIKDKSKDEDKEREKEKENAVSEQRKGGIGRSSSVHLLRKSQPAEPSTRESHSQQTSPIYQTRHSAYYPSVDTTPAYPSASIPRRFRISTEPYDPTICGLRGRRSSFHSRAISGLSPDRISQHLRALSSLSGPDTASSRGEYRY